MPQLNRQDQPPRGGPEMWILRLKAKQSRTLAILSVSLWGTWTHWNGQCSEPCFVEKKACSGCKRGLPKRWKGYLHCWDYHEKREVFLELTPMAADAVLVQCGEGAPLRRNRIQMARGDGDNTRLKVTILSAVPLDVLLPEPKDPKKTLEKLWGIDDVAAYPEQPTALPMNEAQ